MNGWLAVAKVPLQCKIKLADKELERIKSVKAAVILKPE